MKPYLFLDFDDVLNINPDFPGVTYVEYHIDLPVADLPTSPFLNVGSADVIGMRLLFDHRYPAWLQELQKHFDIVWATMWEHAVNTHAAPLLGLNPLPVVEHHKTPVKMSEATSGNTTSWKLRSITSYADRPFAFVDDQAGSYVGTTTFGDDVLIIAPRKGLTRRHVDQLIEFATSLQDHPALADKTSA